jgi:serine/threonine protein kinase
MLTTDNILQGRYQIISQLGQGGMGAVYEAQDKKRFNASVALKEILFDLADETTDAKHQDLLKRAFEREAKILAEVQHEVFPHVIEYFSESDRQFLVMELIKGADMAQMLINRKAPFPLEEILNWTDQLLDALDYLHSYNPPIFHRDLKPQNLKITSRGKIKLLDFGIAKSAEAGLAGTIANQTFIAATLNYSPFEQILRAIDSTLREMIAQRYEEKIKPILEQPADARSDLYALGATLYHLSTAVVPTDALKRTLEVWSGKPDPLRRPHELNPEIPKEISLIFLKAMEVERENRFASAVEMQQALKKAAADVKRREREAAKKREEEAQRAIWLAEQAQLEKERLERERLEKERLERERQLAEQERLRIEKQRQAEQIERQLNEIAAQRQHIEQERLRIKAEQERLEKEDQLIEQERLRTEAKLSELHLHEAEIQKQIADYDTSEAERQLSEKEKPDEAEYSAANTQVLEDLDQQFYTTAVFPQPVEETASYDILPNETADLSFTLPQNRKTSWILYSAALIFLILGGVILGAWFLQPSKTENSNQTNSNQTNSSQASFLSNAATPTPNVEATPETNVMPSLSTEPIATPVSRPAAPKPVAPRVVNPTPQPPKPSPKPKKTLTADDLINDN